MKVYEQHPLAKKIPPPTEDEFGRLRESIRRNGWFKNSRVVLHHDMIIDGWSRYRAAKDEKVEPLYEEYGGDSPVTFVCEQALTRRQLSHVQRLSIGEAMRLDIEREAKSRQRAGKALEDGQGGTTDEIVGRFAGVSKTKAREYHNVAKGAAPELRAAVDKDEFAVSDAAQILHLPPRQQVKAMKQVRKGDADTLREAAPSRNGDDKEHEDLADMTGAAVPKELFDVFSDQSMADAAATLKRLTALAKSTAKWNKYFRLADAVKGLELAMDAFDVGLPYAVHQECNASGCPDCRNCGWTPIHVYEELAAKR